MGLGLGCLNALQVPVQKGRDTKDRSLPPRASGASRALGLRPRACQGFPIFAFQKDSRPSSNQTFTCLKSFKDWRFPVKARPEKITGLELDPTQTLHSPGLDRQKNKSEDNKAIRDQGNPEPTKVEARVEHGREWDHTIQRACLGAVSTLANPKS